MTQAFEDDENPGMTEWKNPTKDDMTVRIFVGNGRWQTYKVAAGKTASIPSEYDRAIQDVHNDVVIGGLAPRLQRVGGPKLKLDSAIVKASEDATAKAPPSAAEKPSAAAPPAKPANG
jgi:hypothetical protein